MFESFILIFLAEMADKTQLMMMTLSTQYTSGMMISGMCIGSIIITYLSTIAGHALTHLIPTAYLQIGAAILFLLFGLATLLQVKETEIKQRHRHRFPILSIAICFIIAELGDKTQLSTIALTTHYEISSVLSGAAMGLIFANLIGIFLGKTLLSKIDERWMRFGSSLLFLSFGTNTLFEVISFHETIRFWIIVFIACCFFVTSLRFLEKDVKSKQ